jgi:hypothetical protein
MPKKHSAKQHEKAAAGPAADAEPTTTGESTAVAGAAGNDTLRSRFNRLAVDVSRSVNEWSVKITKKDDGNFKVSADAGAGAGAGGWV